MKQFLKRHLLREEEPGVYRIKYGIGRGLKMNIDIRNKAQRVLGLDEKEIMKDFKKFAVKCDTFVDIGASDGYYGLLYRKLNNSGEIFLFEPQPQFQELQSLNFKLNDFTPNFHSSQKFVGSVDNEDSVKISSVIPNEGRTIFFKIDVDGGELEVLRGLEEILGKNKCYLIIETHSLELERDCMSFLKNSGFKVKLIKNAFWRKLIPEQRIIDHNRWFTASK